MYSIAHIVLRSDFRRTWQEAIAIVQEVASMGEGLPAIPGPEDLSLTDDGRLEMGFAAEYAEHPVVALARLLSSLLEGTDAPPALRELAAANANEPPAHDDLRGFSQAVAFFERPGRQNDLRALASRLRAAGYGGLEPDQEDALGQLRQKVSGPAPPAVSRVAARERKPLPAWVLPASAGVAVVAALVALLVWQGPALLRLLPGSVSSAAPAAETGSSDPVTVAAAEPPAADQKPQPRLVESTPSAGRPPSPASRRLPIASSGTPGPPRSAFGGLPPVAALPDLAEPGPPVSARQSERAVAEDLIYTADVPGVEPPVLVRRQLPSIPRVEGPMGYFELVVDETGHVEQVRLSSPASRFHERMLMAAAKAWVFEPARLDGRPVRYQVRVPITVPRETFFRNP